jgi:cob(I)alamin adenosyltransferase
MPRITKVTTRTGDRGETSLGTGKRLPKDAPRVAAYGTVDELNSVLGVVLAAGVHPRLAKSVRQLQNELFDLGGDLSMPEPDEEKGTRSGRETRGDRAARERKRLITRESVDRLEEEIAALLEMLPPLENFVMPGGTQGAAHLHVARTVARRAERELVTLRRTERVDDAALVYLNRLSDLLFVMARYDNLMASVPEPTWSAGAGAPDPGEQPAG